jgi:hypothetical protein
VLPSKSRAKTRLLQYVTFTSAFHEVTKWGADMGRIGSLKRVWHITPWTFQVRWTTIKFRHEIKDLINLNEVCLKCYSFRKFNILVLVLTVCPIFLLLLLLSLYIRYIYARRWSYITWQCQSSCACSGAFPSHYVSPYFKAFRIKALELISNKSYLSSFPFHPAHLTRCHRFSHVRSA